jgi:flagellar basal body-associated protein FliL
MREEYSLMREEAIEQTPKKDKKKLLKVMLVFLLLIIRGLVRLK